MRTARRTAVRFASLFVLMLAMLRVPACEYGDGQTPPDGTQALLISTTPAADVASGSAAASSPVA